MSFLSKTDFIFRDFLNHLKNLGVSPSTAKNYRSDIFLFSNWTMSQLKLTGITTETFSQLLPFLSPTLAEDFKKTISSNSNSQKTVNRRLSALRALSRFLVSTQILESDFMEGVANLDTHQESSLKGDPLVRDFQKHLEEQKVSKNTVKNYVSDIKHFLAWLQTNHEQLGSKL